jgi:para-aminobenzoate synthetase/4-amino-4-deoxychorismate lyase
LRKARPVLHPLGVIPATPGPRRRRTLPPLLDIPRPSGGLLETMLAIDGQIPLLDAHLDRLGDHSARAELEAAAKQAGKGRWRVRLVEGRIEIEPARPTRIQQLVPRLIPGGLGDRKWADRRVPSDVLVVDSDGSVLEAAWANVFIVEDGVHITPPADGRLLPGITRARIDAREEPIDLERYEQADAVYLTSAISLVTPVRNPACAPSLSAVPTSDPGWSAAPGR